MSGSAATPRRSPNHRSRPTGTLVDTLVLHYTGMQDGAAALERLCDPEAAVSAHYVVDEDGAVHGLVDETRRAAHAGVSFWRGREDLNDSSIGIEIVNPGHHWGYRPFPEPQVAAVVELATGILRRHPIDPRRIVGHSDVAPDRKEDPGELFPWSTLARAGIGLWPDPPVPDADDPAPIEARDHDHLRAVLWEIGYRTAPPDDPRTALPVLLTAFQRRWRPSRCDGRLDRGSLHVASAVARLHRTER